jgi:glycosyltransferase involved in cell wall biosynthesis
MKISIIIPSQNDTEYLSKLLVFLKANTSGDQIEEIIIVNNFEDKQFNKLAEKAHAKLYIFKDSIHRLKAEAGAFEAKGEILYFIKPGHFPPKYFAERIITAVKLKNELGSLYHPVIARVCRFCNLIWMDRLVLILSPMSNFFIVKKIFLQSGGLRYDGQTSSFYEFLKKKEFRFTFGLIQ